MKDFITAHMDILAGVDFFTVEVLSWPGLVTYCVLFFFIWKAAGSVWWGSPDIRIKSGWNRSPAAHPGDLGISGWMPLCSARS